MPCESARVSSSSSSSFQRRAGQVTRWPSNKARRNSGTVLPRPLEMLAAQSPPAALGANSSRRRRDASPAAPPKARAPSPSRAPPSKGKSQEPKKRASGGKKMEETRHPATGAKSKSAKKSTKTKCSDKNCARGECATRDRSTVRGAELDGANDLPCCLCRCHLGSLFDLGGSRRRHRDNDTASSGRVRTVSQSAPSPAPPSSRRSSARESTMPPSASSARRSAIGDSAYSSVASESVFRGRSPFRRGSPRQEADGPASTARSWWGMRRRRRSATASATSVGESVETAASRPEARRAPQQVQISYRRFLGCFILGCVSAEAGL